MDVYLRVDINLAAMLLLGTVFIIAYRRMDRKDSLNKLFLTVSIIILLEIFFETGTCIINRHPVQWLIPISMFLHVCLFVTAPILTYFWYGFIKSLISPKNNVFSKENIVFLLPVVINTVLILLSPIYKWIFFIDSSNIYHRGQFFILSAAITYFYLIYSLCLIVQNKRKIVRQEYIPLFIFGILPTVGGVFQTLFYGALLMWSFSAFSLVIVYIFLQQRIVQLDSLTGAWTRGSFDYYISQRIEKNSNEPFGIIFVDLDGLKSINDLYGHVEGDYAIKTAVEIIKKVIRKNDIVVRLGGDEFIIILDCTDSEVLERTTSRIHDLFDQYNSNSHKEYNLECSIGADIFSAKYTSIEHFIHNIDTLMYNNKNLKKQLKTQS